LSQDSNYANDFALTLFYTVGWHT